jgi:flavin-dependent dehydrogenase
MRVYDVLVAGAGPAGAVAATVLARAGVRVGLVDRSTFPRPKLCGDTLNPGSLALLTRLRMADAARGGGLPVNGMLVTGDAVAIEGRYPGGLQGRSVTRRDLDWWLVQDAINAGVDFQPGVRIADPLVTDAGGTRCVQGVALLDAAGRRDNRGARITVAADGRHSTIAFALGLARHPATPRRWAIGAYFSNVRACADVGEMHIRSGRYIGVAPVPGDLVNVCVVREPGRADAGAFANPRELLWHELRGDAVLRERFVNARMETTPVMLGPLALDTVGEPPEGLLLAGDAAGFVDPMTGDGLRFAIRGGELAAFAALDALEHGWTGVHARLAAARRREFAAKRRFNRLLRALVQSPAAVRAAAAGARLAPGVVRALIARAGDCDLARAAA